MPPQPDATIIRDKKSITPKQLVIVGLLLAGILALCAFYLVRYQEQLARQTFEAQIEADLQAELARIDAEAATTPFAFTIVPEAPELIVIEAPADTADSDAAAYELLKPTAAVPETVAANDEAWDIPFQGTTYLEYLNNLEDPSLIFQITEELHELTLRFNKMYNRAPLSERINGVTQLAPLDTIVYGEDTVSVYPSVRAVDAYLAAEIMSRIDEPNRNTYTTTAEDIIARGIGYGLYGQSDAYAAKSLVEQYFNLYDEPIVSPDTFIDSSEELPVNE